MSDEAAQHTDDFGGDPGLAPPRGGAPTASGPGGNPPNRPRPIRPGLGEPARLVPDHPGGRYAAAQHGRPKCEPGARPAGGDPNYDPRRDPSRPTAADRRGSG